MAMGRTPTLPGAERVLFQVEMDLGPNVSREEVAASIREVLERLCDPAKVRNVEAVWVPADRPDEDKA